MERRRIDTLIFDFGGVLVHPSDTKGICEAFVSPEDAETIAAELFSRKYRAGLNTGAVPIDEVIRLAGENLPARFAPLLPKIYYSWIYRLREREGMRELIREVKEVYRLPVYLLSNIDRHFADHADEIPILQAFDGCVFSSVVGHVKPNPEIFEDLCTKFSIDPAHAFFIDDKAENVAAAHRCGMDGYVFDGDVQKLRKTLTERLNNR